MMTQIPEHAWRVKVAGRLLGAGVLLGERHVLTCAHVVGDEHGLVSIQGAVNLTVWRRTARVVPGTWAYSGSQTGRGDVALLALDDPAPAGLGTDLWHAPLSAGEVRAYGYPETEPDGRWATATLASSRGRAFELGQLNPVGPEVPWIEPGFSGAGVLVQDGSHAGHVIGIVVLENHDQRGRHASLMPTGTIRSYLPEGFARYVRGEPPDRLRPAGGLPQLWKGDVLRIALTRELARLLTSGWTGTAVIPGLAGTGSQWLVRLVRTSDPGILARATDAELSSAPRDTLLPLGAVDAAYDARGKTDAAITRYLADRFALPGDTAGLVRELLRRKPPACVVIDGVDRAASPGTLIREVLRPLAVGARSRGMRLVLGFDGKPPGALRPYEVLLDHEPLTGGSGHGVSAGTVRERVSELAAAEEEAARLDRANWGRFRDAPRQPPARAPRLGVRLSVADFTGPRTELTAIDQNAALALREAQSFITWLRQADGELTELRGMLEANRERLDRHFGNQPGALDERDPRGARFDQLRELYKQARAALWQAPVDLRAARGLVRRYEDEADGFIGEIVREG